MDNITKKVLADLYVIDNGLRAHEDKLIKIINELLAGRPDTGFDDKFARQLRQQVLERARLLTGNKSKSSIIGFMNLKNFSFALSGAIIAALIIIPAMGLFYKGYNISDRETSTADLGFEQKIAKLDIQAFGSLRGEAGSSENTAGPDSAEPLAKSGSDTSQPAMMADEKMSTPPGYGGGGGVGESMIMPAPDFIDYQYQYVGEDLPLIDGMLAVYRRQQKIGTGNDLAAGLKNYQSSLLDSDKFKEAELANFNLTEDRDFGYMFYFNLQEGMVSINSNWERWPQPYQNCQDNDCYEKLRLKQSDVPSDSELIAIADKFLLDYNIKMDNFSSAYVMDTWSNMLARGASEIYIPDNIQVVYPLKINGQTVYDQGGNQTGIYVDINIRYRKVAGLNTLQTQNFEQSSYEAVTDADKLLAVALKGGLNPVYYYFAENGDKTEVLKLGTPQTALMQYWKQNPSGARSEELFVPVLVFPIVEKSDNLPDFRNHIIVPLIKEIFDERLAGGDDDRPSVLPMGRIEPTIIQSDKVDSGAEARE